MDVHLSPGQQRRVVAALSTGAYSSADEVIDRALEMLQQQDESLLANREAVNAKIQRGIGELERGEGIPEDQLAGYLARLKSRPE